jgi:hypothetical protein
VSRWRARSGANSAELSTSRTLRSEPMTTHSSHIRRGQRSFRVIFCDSSTGMSYVESMGQITNRFSGRISSAAERRC